MMPPDLLALAKLQRPSSALFVAVFLSLDLLRNVDSYGKFRERGTKLAHLRRAFSLKSGNDSDRISIANMTCDFITQPLNHFLLPRDASLTYRQRYCVYDGFVERSYRSDGESTTSNGGGTTVPLFLYTGNESPLPEYINNTGLMFELAAEMGAQVIFVEHRYEGESLPSPEIPNCLAYSSSVQALADYAAFLAQNQYRDRPIVAFGGSYGGMLSAWLRFLYPHMVAGAIAGSAPIFGFPRISPRNIDAAWQVIRHGMQQPYPPTTDPIQGDVSNFCATNVLAAWPLMQVLGESEEGRRALSEAFRLCSALPANATDKLIGFAQSPWFDMAGKLESGTLDVTWL
jgi:lysosomal Pro-X carboxypeptidase